MTTVERDAAFRERLEAAYQTHNLGVADSIIHAVSRTPQLLTGVENCRALLFGLELWAACFGRPHPAVAHIKRTEWRMWRHATTCEGACDALFWLSQSPYGAEFAEDTHQLRPRLFAIAQKYPARQTVPSTSST